MQDIFENWRNFRGQILSEAPSGETDYQKIRKSAEYQAIKAQEAGKILTPESAVLYRDLGPTVPGYPTAGYTTEPVRIGGFGGGKAERFETKEEYMEWLKKARSKPIRGWGQDPGTMTPKEWAKSNNFDYYPEKTTNFDEWKRIFAPEFRLVQTGKGYGSSPEGTELIPTNDTRTEAQLRSEYDELVRKKDIQVYREERWYGKTANEMFRGTVGDRPGREPYGGGPMDRDDPGGRKGPKRQTRTYTLDELKELIELDKKAYKLAQKQAMDVLRVELSVLDRIEAKKGPRVARQALGELEPEERIITALGKSDTPKITRALDSGGFFEFDEASQKSQLYNAFEEAIGEVMPKHVRKQKAVKLTDKAGARSPVYGFDLKTEEIKSASRKAAQEVIKSSAELTLIADPEAYYKGSVFDYSKRTPREVRNIFINSTDWSKNLPSSYTNLEIEITDAMKPLGNSYSAQRARLKDVFSAAVRSAKGQDLLEELASFGLGPRQRRDKIAKGYEGKLVKKIIKLGLQNIKRQNSGKPPFGMKRSKNAAKPRRGVKPESLFTRGGLARNKVQIAPSYDTYARTEELVESIQSQIEVEHSMRMDPGKADERLKIIKDLGSIQAQETMSAQLNAAQSQYAVDESKGGPKYAKEQLKSRLKALPFIGRIIVAGLLSDSALQSFLFGYDGAPPGPEGFLKWAGAPFEKKDGMPYMAASMTPILGDYLGIRDLSDEIFPSFRQQVANMQAKVARGKYEREQARREKGFQQKVGDYDAAVRAAERSAERSGGRLVVDPRDRTRLISPEELQKIRDDARRRMRDAGPSPGSGMPSRLRESKIKTKRLKITLKN